MDEITIYRDKHPDCSTVRLDPKSKSEPDETDYLLASPNNAAHLRKALKDFQNGQRNFASQDLIERMRNISYNLSL